MFDIIIDFPDSEPALNVRLARVDISWDIANMRGEISKGIVDLIGGN